MPRPRMPIADDTMALQLDAIYAVDDAIRSRSDELTGVGHVRCPKCGGQLAYQFTRKTFGSRKLSFVAVCERVGCNISMRGDG